MLGALFGTDPIPELGDNTLLLRGGRAADYGAWRRVRAQSREFLKPFEPRWGEADLSPSAYRQRLARARREARAGCEFAFFMFRNGELVGGLTLSNVRRRAAQFANLGYWMGAESAGQGLMTRGVGLLLPFVFDTLELNRLHAACLPHNAASRRVLEKNGFREEGYAEQYLEIDGRWQDHVLYGLTRHRYREAREANRQ